MVTHILFLFIRCVRSVFHGLLLLFLGRAGRVSDGRVYRMITRHFWESYIPDYGIPEMQVCSMNYCLTDIDFLERETFQAFSHIDRIRS